MKVESSKDFLILTYELSRLGSISMSALAATVTLVALMSIAMIYINGAPANVHPSTLSALFSAAKWGALICAVGLVMTALFYLRPKCLTVQ